MLTDTLRIDAPTSPDEVLALVADAAASVRRLEIVGGGTKRSVGAVRDADAVLSLAKLDKVIDYAPEELVLTAQAGARLADLERLVVAEGQMLPFEPPHLTGLLGSAGAPTLGGVLATNLSGPRRLRVGAARDHFLGFEAITGRGERMKAGGKVVKNVTGYDLSKLMAGSWGTLAVLTEVTIKVLPAPRTELTLMLSGLDDRRAGEAMTLAMGTAAEVSGAAHLPAQVAGRAPLAAATAVTVFRLEGFAASVAARAEHLAAALKGFGAVEALAAEPSRDVWRQIREVEAFQGATRPLWRIAVPPDVGWRVGEALAGEALYDWAGGLVWVLADDAADAAAVRPAVAALGGHATLYRGAGAAFEPLSGTLATLTARVKAAFDPAGILNPGRL